MRNTAAMSNTYVIPDLHGGYDLLSQGLARIAEHAKDDPATIVAIGDDVGRRASWSYPAGDPTEVPENRRLLRRLEAVVKKK